MRVYIGHQPEACDVAARSLVAMSRCPAQIEPLRLDSLRAAGLYRRPTERRGDQLWDVISDAPMSTEHAIARFLVPQLAREGWAMFCDGDVLFRADLGELELDPRCALMCVQ